MTSLLSAAQYFHPILRETQTPSLSLPASFCLTANSIQGRLGLGPAARLLSARTAQAEMTFFPLQQL